MEGCNTRSKFTDIAFLVFGRFRERYITPGWDEPAGLRNASASDEAETLYPLLDRCRVGAESLQDRDRIVPSMVEDPGLANVGNLGPQWHLIGTLAKGYTELGLPLLIPPSSELEAGLQPISTESSICFR